MSLSIDQAMSLPVGKGILVESKNYRYRALVVGVAKTHMRLITENGALSKPQFCNYDKTWKIGEAV